MNKLLSFVFALAFVPSTALAQTIEDAVAAYDAANYKAAQKIAEPLAEAGDARAMNLIGLMYEYGDVYPRDIHRACDLYEKSAQGGFVGGQVNLAICYQYGRGRPEDMEKSIYWTVKAAEQGDLRSQTFLVTYFDDHGRRDLAEKWALESVKSDSVYARVIAWSQQVEHEGKQATMSEIACVFFNSFLLRKGWKYCE